MKVKSRKIPSVYNDFHARDRKRWTSLTIFILLLLTALGLIRFGHLTMTWHMTRLELQKKPISDGEYRYIGLADDRKAAEELENLSIFGRHSIGIVAYYNLAQPAKFMIHNRAAAKMVDLGRMVIYACQGNSAVVFYASGLVSQKCPDGESAAYYEIPLLSPFIQVITGRRADKPGPSFILKSLAQTGFLKIPYLLYFYVPLAVIVLLTMRFGLGFLMACFYYVEIFLLFDFRQALVEVPFSWALRGIGLQLTDGWAWGIAAGLMVLAVAGTVLGAANWRQFKSDKWGIWCLFLVLLLPLALRF